MHPFLAVYDLQPLKMHPLVFAPGVPVTAQVVGTERYTSGSKVAGLAPGGGKGRAGQGRRGCMQPNHGTSIQFLTPPGGNLHSVFCPLDSWQLYLDNQEEVPSFPGAASGPPETQSLDESAPSGSVRGTRLLPLKDRCPTPWGSLCCHCPAPSLLWVGACPTPGPQLFLLQVLPPILATEPPSLTPVTRKPSPLGLSCPWFCASVSPGLDAQNAFGSLF